MSEHRRKQQPEPSGSTGRGRGEQPPARPQGRPAGAPPRRTASPQGAAPTTAQPRMTRAEMRKAAQAKGRRGADAGNRMEGGSGGRRGGKGPGGPTGPKPKRFLDYPRWGKRGVRRWIPSFKQILSVTLLGAASLVGLVSYAYANVTIPDPSKLSALQSNTYYWADGTQMARRGSFYRQNVDLSTVPKAVQNDFLAAENASFWTDSGVDPQGILRAVYHMVQGGEVQSGSTITQQYIKNTRLSQTQSVSRKFDEILMAVKMGSTPQDKITILQGYLNTSYFGRGAYGIEAAAKTYYGVSASQLNPSQGAFLAALVNGPSFYDPAGSDGQGTDAARNLQNATARWTWIMGRLPIDNLLPADQEQQWLAKGFPMPKPIAQDSSKSGYIGYLVDLANNNMLRKGIQQSDLDKGGYQIYTTFDKKSMDEMKAAVDTTFKGQLDPKRTVTDQVKGDSHEGQKYSVDAWMHAGGASVKPGDGAVTAIYGGPDYMKQQFDDADNPGVQVGSTFKAFVLAAALQDGTAAKNAAQGTTSAGGASGSPGGGGISLNSLYNGNNNLVIKNADGSVWTDSVNKTGLKMPNDSGENLGIINLKTAMAQSINTVYVQLGMDVGMNNVKAAAVAAGAGQPGSGVYEATSPTFALGTSHPGPIRMAAAYATFAASGMEADPYEVSRYVLNGQSTSLKSVPHQVFVPGVADSVTAALRGVIQDPKGTGARAKALGWDAAGKTGTTDSKKSAWFVGYTKNLSTAIGLWDQSPSDHSFWPLIGLAGKQDIYGADFPTEIWTAYMQAALNGQSPQTLPTDPHYGSVQNESGVSSPTPSATATPSASTQPPVTHGPTPPTTVGPSQTQTPPPSPTDTCAGLLGCGGLPTPTDTSSSGGPSPTRSSGHLLPPPGG
ncbi:transglycosylase domain-containing protein [Streptacidiphilus sp. EB129]|uniref:transglycosylase domain-containing protein n=1 Tax=Streptacidiphilus sp. EB129 TaxID=3156262 RepID=UPI00351513B3